MRDGMIDLETWGQYAPCALRSVAVVQFDPYSDKVGDRFYANVTKESCLEIGLMIDPKTEAWWAQPKMSGAAAVLGKDQISVRDAMNRMCIFWRKCSLKYPWSQGANFDQPIIEEVMRRLGIEPPWKFWDSACTRTAYRMSGLNVFNFKNKGIPHYALDDCLHQIGLVQMSHRKLGLHGSAATKEN
jgi:hypothetical protein